MFENHQKLYKVSASTGKTQVWFGWSIGDYVCCSYGQLNGKLQKSAYQTEGKNIGKSNETTGLEQAQLEMQAMYKDQIENKHYFTSEIEATEKSQVCRIPRKVYNYKDKKDKWEGKLMLSSRKFNGSRGCVVEDLFSKIGRKEDIKVDHLREALETLKGNGLATFDAEVYAHGLPLQRIRSAWLKPVRTDKEIVKVAKDFAKKTGKVFNSKSHVEAIEFLGYNPNEDAPLLKFYVFDIPDDTGIKFKDRINNMRALNDNVFELGIAGCFEFEYPVETNSNEERLKLREEWVAQGGEGMVHYDPDGIYEYGKRSSNTF